MPKVKPSLKSVRLFENPYATKNADKEKEIRLAEEIVFGKGSDILDVCDEKDEDNEEEEEGKTKEEETVNEVTIVDEETTVEKQPAWIDETDTRCFDEIVKIQGRKCITGVNGTKSYQNIVEDKYQSLMGQPRWAKTPKEKSKSDSLLLKSGSLVKSSKALEKGHLELKKMKNLNQETYTEGPIIKVLKFHPKSTVAMVGGVSGVLSLFQVDGQQNAKLHSIQFKRYPIHCGEFYNNAEEILLGSRHHKFFYNFNMMTSHHARVDNSKTIDVTRTNNFVISPDNKFIALCGRFGNIYLLSSSSKELITSFKMNCDVKAVVFTPDSSRMFSHGRDGEVYVWDLRSRQCVQRFVDEGCLTGTCLDVSSSGQLLACGSSAGIVNVYDTNKLQEKSVRPVHVIDNLVTNVDCVRFNHSGEILSVFSSDKNNAVKLVHSASMTVFANFPTFQTVLNRPQCVDFSPNSGFYALGDNRGSAHLFRLKYYGNY